MVLYGATPLLRFRTLRSNATRSSINPSRSLTCSRPRVRCCWRAFQQEPPVRAKFSGFRMFSLESPKKSHSSATLVCRSLQVAPKCHDDEVGCGKHPWQGQRHRRSNHCCRISLAAALPPPCTEPAIAPTTTTPTMTMTTRNTAPSTRDDDHDQDHHADFSRRRTQRRL